VDTRIERTVDLTGASSAQLLFDYAGAGLDPGDTAGGGGEQQPHGHVHDAGHLLRGALSAAPPYDLTSYVSPTTTVRFWVTGGYDTGTEALSSTTWT